MKIFINFIVVNLFIIIGLHHDIFISSCNASMGSLTINAIGSEQLNCSEQLSISRTTLRSLASQQRTITISDASGIMMLTDFSIILTSTELSSSHNGLILVSGNISLTLPDPLNVLGTTYTIKKIDPSSTTVTISGIVDGENNQQLVEQYSYITIISNGSAWFKVAENPVNQSTSVNQTYLTNSLGMTFRLIPSGSFLMGSPSDELGRQSDETQYTVTISESFYIQTTEVTQGQWKVIMGNNPSNFNDCGFNCPVENISWDDAQSFITTLNAMGEGSYTLPTEAQWEYAARAGHTKAFSSGDISNTTTDSNLDLVGWYSSNSNSTTNTVAQKLANAWGLFDIHGNVWEWCLDWYDTYPTNSVTDPEGPASGSARVLRGGSWNFEAQNSRVARRGSGVQGDSYSHIGLRLLRTVD